ncbi:endo-1,4-beta-xylanase A precursor [Mycena olivaceomarginata]|nr:endo-1,4-beta-xylanase A precursor [Mycena olivaceomarginata]
MLRISASLATVLALVPVAIAQSANNRPFGVNTCVQGSVCTFQNDFYSQCLPVDSSDGTATTTTGGSGTTAALPTVKSNTVAKSLGKKLYFGSATDNLELTDAAYVATLSDNTLFSQLTPGNSIKWDTTEPSRGKLCFMFGKSSWPTHLETLLRPWQRRTDSFYGHNCVWYNQLPSRVSSRGFNATTLTSILETHCSTVVKHYAGQIYSWDVVNEPFNDDGTVRPFVFCNALGLAYDTTALINDHNIDSAGSKATAMINLVKSLKATGTPVDDIGIQGHLIVGQVPLKAALIANYQAFTALGVEIAITELDIRMVLPETPALLAQQQMDYNTVISACKAVAGCVGDYTDKYFWIAEPAYDGIIAGFTN